MLSEVMYDLPDVRNMMFSEKGSRDVLPTESAPVICRKEEGLVITPSFWGFPYVFEGQKKLAVNARSETAASKRLFSQAMHEARCAVPVSAFYEYTKDKQKVTFRGERPVLYLAGCMAQDRFVILTREPDEVVGAYHDRMPLLVEKEDVEEWVSAKNLPSRLMGESRLKLTAHVPYQQMSLFDL